jgi:hypothetical protein
MKYTIIHYWLVKFAILEFIFSLFSISCSTASLTPSTQVTIPSDYLGVAGGDTSADNEYQLINELGIVWVSQTFYWSRIEKEKGNFTFSSYDNYVNKAKEHGKKVLALLAYASPWLNDGKDNKYISKENIHHFLNYIEVIVTRYKGKVDAWQIWNEPNWIFWKGTNNEFYELSRLAANKIREVDPAAYIIGGGFQRLPKNFIKNMKKAGALENLDAFSIHPYDINPKGSIRLLDNFFKIASKVDFKGDIWITEIGFPTSGWYISRVSLKKMPSYVIKTIAPAAASGSRALIWYQFQDNYNYGEYPNKFDSELYFGLAYLDFSRKKGAWAYELCGRYLPGSRYNPELPLKENIKSNIITLCFTGNSSNTNTLIIWNDNIIKQKIKVTIPSTISIHDISTGSNYSLQNETIIEVSEQPVFITWQGSSIPQISSVRK